MCVCVCVCACVCVCVCVCVGGEAPEGNMQLVLGILSIAIDSITSLVHVLDIEILLNGCGTPTIIMTYHYGSECHVTSDGLWDA